MSSRYCQFDEFRETRSLITQRVLLVNESPDRIYISRSAPYDRLPALVEALKERLSAPDMKYRTESKLVSTLWNFDGGANAVEFAAAIDHLIDVTKEVEHLRGGQKMRTILWLQRLCSEGFLALPAKSVFKTKVALFLDPFGLPETFDWVKRLSAASGYKESARVPGIAVRALMTAIGVREVGDLCPHGVSSHFFVERAADVRDFVTPLLAIQRSTYGDTVPYTFKDWGMGRKSRGFDRSYTWAVEKDATLRDWQAKIAEWLKTGRSLALRTYMADRFFAYLLEYPGLSRSPADYCLRHHRFQPSWAEWSEKQDWAKASLQHYTNYLADFFDWYIHHYLTAEDDYGHPVVSPIHFNPITRFGISARQQQSHREALPLRYIHELIRILQEDDYAWPRRQPSDYFMWHDAATGEFQRIWSPVRAVALLIKLHLPLRTYQVRMLDSGEDDTEVLRDGGWQESHGLTKKSVVRRGFLRRIRDTSTGREFTGLYVNTNKTADIYKDAKDTGYEIPWQHDEVVRLVQYLLAWQRRHNPIQKPLQWHEIHDKVVLRSHSKDMLRLRGEICFLFRDPKGVYPAEPVADSKLQIYWVLLLRELERRVAARGEILPDGSPIKFVVPPSGTSKSALPSPLFDLHSLRVALITAYAIEGGVPIQVLSKCVAGHATVLMTLYYTKPGPAYVTEQLVKAQEKIQRQEQANFMRFLQDTSVREASPLVVTNDPGALQALDNSHASGWVVGDLGICPVGMGRCHQGGPKMSEATTKLIRFLPVPGGAKNCVRCRYFVTGPAFLGGLVASFNSTGIGLMEAAEQLRRIEGQICDLEDLAGPSDDLGRLYSRRDTVLEKVDLLAHNWHAAYGLIERSKAAVKASKAGNRINLVLAGDMGDLQTALVEGTQFDLFNAVCQTAVVYPNEGSTLANLRRGRLLDAMLSQNGRMPVFASLSEEEALSVGNEFVNLLIARFGHTDTTALIEGRKLLDATGIAAEIDRLLERHQPSTVLHQARHFTGELDVRD